MFWAARALQWYIHLVIPNQTWFRKSQKLFREGDSVLQLSHLNEECLVRMCHQRILNTSLLFVHTARRSYWLNFVMRTLDRWRLSRERQGITLECLPYRNLFESCNLEEGWTLVVCLDTCEFYETYFNVKWRTGEDEGRSLRQQTGKRYRI